MMQIRVMPLGYDLLLYLACILVSHLRVDGFIVCDGPKVYTFVFVQYASIGVEEIIIVCVCCFVMRKIEPEHDEDGTYRGSNPDDKMLIMPK